MINTIISQKMDIIYDILEDTLSELNYCLRKDKPNI